MDISQVTDDETGKYRILCETLAGRGVSDIDVALREIFLKELYRAFTAVVSAEFLADMALFGMSPVQLKNTKAEVPAIATILERLEEPMKQWFQVANQFIEGNYGASQVVDRTKCGTMAATDKLWAGFKEDFTRLLKLFASIPSVAGTTGSATAAAKSAESTRTKFQSSLFQGLLERPAATQMLAGMMVAFSLRQVLGSKATASQAAALISLWGLERKLQDLLLNEGVPVAATAIPLKTIVLTLSFCDLLTKLKPAKTTAATGTSATSETAKKSAKAGAEVKVDAKAVKAVAGIMVDAIVAGKDAREVAGVNLYDNILWFNEEKMEDALWFAVAIPAFLGGGLDGGWQEAGLEAVDKSLAAAQKKSQYRADQLCRLLPPPVVKKPAKKSTTKEAAAGKRNNSAQTGRKPSGK